MAVTKLNSPKVFKNSEDAQANNVNIFGIIEHLHGGRKVHTMTLMCCNLLQVNLCFR